MKLAASSLIGCALALGACSSGEVPPATDHIAIEVAPLDLPGIDFACYDLLIQNEDSQTVIALGDPATTLLSPTPDAGTLCSTQYGNGTGGDLAYIAPCDASRPSHTVTLWVDGLYVGTPQAPVGIDYQDPCPGGCELTVPCEENADTSVVFNLTVMRPALQGFFDVAVNFDDIFCSAKVDCAYSPTEPIELLFHPVTGERSQTAVLALACTGGPRAAGEADDTVLLRDPIIVQCGGLQTALDPTAGPGNAYTTAAPDPDPSDAVWQYATYIGNETLPCGAGSCDKRYWNVAVGFDPSTPDCTLTTSATAASSAAVPGFGTPSAATYPLIAHEVTLTGPNGGLVCSQHPLNGSPAGVSTSYTDVAAPHRFCHRYDGATLTSDDPASCGSQPAPAIALGWYAHSPYYSFDPTYTAGLSDAERIAHWSAPLVAAKDKGWDFVMMYGLNHVPYHYRVGGKVYDTLAYLDEAKRLGVKVLMNIENSGYLPSDAAIRALVAEVKDKPAVYGYYLFDEPEGWSAPPYNVTPAACLHAYELLKSLDPERPVYLTMAGSISANTGYLAAADVIAKVIYNDDHWDRLPADLAAVKRAGLPFVVIPRVYRGGAAYSLVLPTAEQFQYNVFAPISLGAMQDTGGGVFPFLFEGHEGTGQSPPPSDFRAELVYPTTDLVQQITPHLVAGRATGCALQWQAGSEVYDAQVRRVLLGEGSDDVVLVMVNDSDVPATVSFTIAGLDPATSLAVRLDAPGAAASLTVAAGQLSNVTFAAREVQVYRLSAP